MICMIRIYMEKVSENDYSQSIKGKAYKVFKVKNGKLYPPMVDNKGGVDTPTGVWLDAEEGEFAGLSATGRKQVKASGGGKLAYRPGWHLGDLPVATQFDRAATFEYINEDEIGDVKPINVNKFETFVKSKITPGNAGKIFYIKDKKQYVRVYTDGKPHLPYDFIWAECEYVMDINYQDEATEMGYMRTRKDGSTYKSSKYQHSYAGLPKLPANGYYRYRTNPKPDTVPWVITGAMKVVKLLDDFEVDRISSGRAPVRQGGMATLKELGLKQI